MMHNNSYLSISSDALKQNLRFLRRHFHKDVLISSVVKGDAYGHGIETFVPIALQNRINHFSVFDSSEARRVKKIVGDKAHVMIMGWLAPEDIDWVLENGVSFYVFGRTRLEMAIKASKKLAKKCLIHIELETGMNRTGFQESEMKSLLRLLDKNREHIELKGLCTHYAGAESISNYYRIQQQMKKFDKLCAIFSENNWPPERRHTACSAAAMMYPETQMDMVRIGIMQYGFWPSAEVMVNYFNQRKNTHDPLKRLISWKSQVMSVRAIKRGEFIGYGNSFMADGNMKIAVVPIGYAHGYSRNLSNLGRVLINGERCGVVGNINMNMMMVDVSFLPKVAVGDEVVLIGNQNEQEISVASFSDYSNMLNYELLTRISTEIPRVSIK